MVVVKILVVTQYYPPESAFIAPSVARSLEKNGHDVRVLTGYPNYPKGIIFAGYKQKWRSRERDGSIDVLRVPLYPNHSMKVIARALNYISFSVSAATAWRFAREVDVIYVYATQMTPALGPWMWRKLGGGPYVLHVQDLWPDSIIGSSMVSGSKFTTLIDWVLTPWIKSVYKNAAGVIAIAPTMVTTLVARGAPVSRTKLIYNWSVDVVAERNISRNAVKGSVTNFLFAGNVGDMQDLETVVRAAHLVKDKSISVTIVGDGVALHRVQALVNELGASNVEFEGRVARDKMASIYAQADFALVTLKNLAVFRGTIPSKFQASISHGLPVVTNVQGDLRELVEGLDIGFTSEAENPESMAEALLKASEISAEEYNDLRQRTRRAYLDCFSQSSAVEAIEKIFSEALERS